MRTFIRPFFRILLLALASVELFGQPLHKAPTQEAVSNKIEVAKPSVSTRDVVTELRRVRVDSDSDWEVPPAVSHNLKLLKQRLLGIIVQTLAVPNAAAIEPDAVATDVIDQLAKEDVPVGDSGNGYGVISSIEFRRPTEYPSWLVATTTLSIPYGEDTSLYLFELHGASWKHVLTVESNGYKNIGDAQGWLTYRVAPASGARAPYLVTAEVSPAPESVWQALRLKVLRIGADPDHPKLLAKRTLSYCIEDDYLFSVHANGFGLIYPGDAVDSELAGYRGVHYIEYGVSPTRAWIERETAVDPYNMISKWAAENWTIAHRSVDTSAEAGLREWHTRLRKDHWQCGLSGMSTSHHSIDGDEQLLSVVNCTEGENGKSPLFAVLRASHSGFRILSFSTTKPDLPEIEGVNTYFAGINGLTDPVPVDTPQPKWPVGVSKDAGEATLRMSAVIDEHGGVTDVSVIDWPDKTIAVPGIQAVKKWKYSPGRLDGKPVKVQIQVEVSFER